MQISKILKNILKVTVLCALGFVVLYIAFVAFMMHLFSFHGYNGERKDLYSVAVNNVFGIYGYHSNGEVAYSPRIHVIETDDYGRTLFFYGEYHDYSIEPEVDYGMAFVIMQSSDDKYACFYPDVCYIPYFDTESNWEDIRVKLSPNYFDQLKEDNDWNEEPDEEKYAKVKIVKEKPKGKLRPKGREIDKRLYVYELQNGNYGIAREIHRSHRYCEADRYGRELYYVYGMTRTAIGADDYVSERVAYAVIVNADGSFAENGIVRIAHPEDSFALIQALKQNTNWNNP